jgi:hypothetical protein
MNHSKSGSGEKSSNLFSLINDFNFCENLPANGKRKASNRVSSEKEGHRLEAYLYTNYPTISSTAAI